MHYNIHIHICACVCVCVQVCRGAWLLAHGFQHTRNSRMRGFERLVRLGTNRPVDGRTIRLPASNIVEGDYARAFLKEYILLCSEKNPACTTLHVNYCGHQQLYKLYAKDVAASKCVPPRVPLKASYFKKVWAQVMSRPVYDMATGRTYKAVVRKRFAPGFSICNVCEKLRHRLEMASTLAEKAVRVGMV